MQENAYIWTYYYTQQQLNIDQLQSKSISSLHKKTAAVNRHCPLPSDCMGSGRHISCWCLRDIKIIVNRTIPQYVSHTSGKKRHIPKWYLWVSNIFNCYNIALPYDLECKAFALQDIFILFSKSGCADDLSTICS